MADSKSESAVRRFSGEGSNSQKDDYQQWKRWARARGVKDEALGSLLFTLTERLREFPRRRAGIIRRSRHNFSIVRGKVPGRNQPRSSWRSSGQHLRSQRRKGRDSWCLYRQRSEQPSMQPRLRGSSFHQGGYRVSGIGIAWLSCAELKGQLCFGSSEFVYHSSGILCSLGWLLAWFVTNNGASSVIQQDQTADCESGQRPNTQTLIFSTSR